ncbi:MAG: hypothetical protein JRD19_06075, partial [Deltaproteobacteria bacterium]|nr:hypothetical protein [Deltaproteobacteria bacterium]
MYSLFKRFIFCFPIIFISTWILHGAVRPSSAGPFDHDDKEALKSEKQCYRDRQSRSDRKKREMMDRLGGLPPEILALQSNEMVQIPTIDDAVKIALAAAEEAALPLIDTKFHINGKTITVPDDYQSIQ